MFDCNFQNAQAAAQSNLKNDTMKEVRRNVSFAPTVTARMRSLQLHRDCITDGAIELVELINPCRSESKRT
jgi:hypothetical protein